MEGLEPLAKREHIETLTIRDHVYRELREAILVGKLKPDERLIETRLAQLLKVSRTPLREAIQMLEQEGLVERLPQGGVRVRSVNSEEVRQLNAVRMALECLAVEEVCDRVRNGLLEESEERMLSDLDVLFLRSEKALARNNLIELLKLGYEFHQTIHVLSNNAYAVNLLRQTIGLMERYRALVPPTRNRTAAEEHRAIATAIMAGDSKNAVELMRAHLESAGTYYEETIRQFQPDLARQT